MYLLIKTVHVCAAILTISGFVLRGAWMLSESPMLQHRLVRILPHIVDTVFLLSGIGLIWILQLPVLNQPWILAKLVAVVAYILLGMVALRRGKSVRARLIAFVLAVSTFAYITGVALSKSMLSWLAVAFV